MVEKSIQSKVLDYLNSLPDCIAENVSGNASQSGRADINGCYRGRAFKIELKSKDTGYKATKQQKLYIKRWEAAGAITGVAYSVEDVKKLLRIDMKFKDLTPVEKIDFVARYIIIHSILYYEMDESIISDKKFDRKAQSLVSLMEKYPKSLKKSMYYNVIYDFDGSTGFHLYGRLTKSQKRYHKQIAYNVLKHYKETH